MVAPVLTLSGRPIAASAVRGASHVGLKRLRIEWGRRSLLETPQPGIAIVETITRGLEATPPRKGEKLTIAHPAHGYVFRGKVAAASTLERTLRFPNGLRETVKVTTITAHDLFATLAQFIPTGPGVERAGRGEYTPAGGWYSRDIDVRVAEVAEAGAAAFVTTIEKPDPIVQYSPRVRAMAPPQSAASASAFELLTSAYAMAGVLASCTYDARDDSLRPAPHAPAASAVVTLAQGANGLLSIVLPSGVGKLPARLAVIDRRQLEYPAEDVSAARFDYVHYFAAGTPATYTYATGTVTAPVPGAGAGGTYSPAWKTYWTRDFFVTPITAENAERTLYLYNSGTPGWLPTETAAAFGALNGLGQLPTLTIDPEAPELAGFGQTFHTRQQGAFYLAGSMFNGEAGAPSVVQFIGGTLSYDERGRWRHALIPAPTRAGAPDTLTLDQMFPASATDRLDNWAADLTLNDLAAVTRRTP
ncbi:hypothetical protein [Microbacterium sp. NPDC087665]|uniref:hypothetical protein n=1 Tax=Microbacterium sp. NPDC087665 TaxID=3364194 RepID=UPI00382D8C7B